MFSEKRKCTELSTASQNVVKQKRSRQTRSNTTVNLMSTVFYTVSFFVHFGNFY